MCIRDSMDACLEAGLGITGINAEVLLGQWEYQVFAKGGKNCLLYTSPSPRDRTRSRMPSSA